MYSNLWWEFLLSELQGHFVHLQDYDENRNQHFITEHSLVSTWQIFPEDGCVTFWYILNSTVARPNALTAQLFVKTVDQSENEELLWYVWSVLLPVIN